MEVTLTAAIVEKIELLRTERRDRYDNLLAEIDAHIASRAKASREISKQFADAVESYGSFKDQTPAPDLAIKDELPCSQTRVVRNPDDSPDVIPTASPDRPRACSTPSSVHTPPHTPVKNEHAQASGSSTSNAELLMEDESEDRKQKAALDKARRECVRLKAELRAVHVQLDRLSSKRTFVRERYQQDLNDLDFLETSLTAISSSYETSQRSALEDFVSHLDSRSGAAQYDELKDQLRAGSESFAPDEAVRSSGAKTGIKRSRSRDVDKEVDRAKRSRNVAYVAVAALAAPLLYQAAASVVPHFL